MARVLTSVVSFNLKKRKETREKKNTKEKMR